jgi:hypothetical protein
MAARSGAAGVFGWLTLGFLGGVAVTLAVETLMFGAKSAQPAEAVAAPARLQVPVSQLPAAPKPVVSSAKASTPPATHYSSPQPEGEVADDAAAAGMTTRSSPRGGDSPN